MRFRSRCLLLALGSLLAVVLLPWRASATFYTDDLTRCVVKAATPDDLALLIRWMFGLMTLNPALQSMSNVTAEQRSDLNRQAGELYVRLLSENCHTEAVAAIKADGLQATGAPFGVLGGIAARSIMSNERVVAGMADFKAIATDARLKALRSEAGLGAR
jgi:hypothetical protein